MYHKVPSIYQLPSDSFGKRKYGLKYESVT